MEWRIKEWNTSTGAYKRTLGYLKSVSYKAQCNDTSDFRFGSLLSEVLTVEIYNSTETKLTQGAWVSFEANNNPAADDDSRTAGYDDSNYTFYGIYKIDQIIDGKGFYSFVAYSVTHDLNVDYSARLKELGDSGSFPMTIQDIVNDACNFAGLSFSRRGAYTPLGAQINKFYSNGITVGDILSAAAEIDGAIVADVMGRYNTPPTSPISTQRGVVFQSILLRTNYNIEEGHNAYYLVAPTDAAVDHSAFNDAVNPWFANVYYKENGFEAGDPVKAVTLIESYTASGGYSYFGPGGTPANPYRITGNVFVDNAVNGVSLYNVWWYINNTLGNPIMRPATIRLFPFNCPFRCGDIANVTNGNGISFQMPIMQFEINDDEAVLESSGNEFYESAQNQYTTPEEVGTNNSVEIEKLRETKADLSMLANGNVIFGRFTINGNSSISLTIPNNERCLIVTSGVTSAIKSMSILACNTSGSVTNSIVLSGSAISYSTSTNGLTISSSNANTTTVCVFSFGGGAVTS